MFTVHPLSPALVFLVTHFSLQLTILRFKALYNLERCTEMFVSLKKQFFLSYKKLHVLQQEYFLEVVNRALNKCVKEFL